MNEEAKIRLFDLVDYAPLDYEKATALIIGKAEKRESYGVSALAVHGFIEAARDERLREQVGRIDLVVPDGQPIRWALNFYYGTDLKDRVYGPVLTGHVLREADRLKLGVYLYGSTRETLEKFVAYIAENFPDVEICGTHADRFREATPEEDLADIKKINDSGAQIVLVGRGCPRQERWVADHLGKIDGALLAVGAAFNFYAGDLKQAPGWMQDRGLEWLYRLIQEPRRLWRRYFFTNSLFIYLFIKHFFRRNLNLSKTEKRTVHLSD